MNNINLEKNLEDFYNHSFQEDSFENKLEIEYQIINKIIDIIKILNRTEEYLVGEGNFDSIDKIFGALLHKSRIIAEGDSKLYFIFDLSSLHRANDINGIHGNYIDLNKKANDLISELNFVLDRINKIPKQKDISKKYDTKILKGVISILDEEFFYVNKEQKKLEDFLTNHDYYNNNTIDDEAEAERWSEYNKKIGFKTNRNWNKSYFIENNKENLLEQIIRFGLEGSSACIYFRNEKIILGSIEGVPAMLLKQLIPTGTFVAIENLYKNTTSKQSKLYDRVNISTEEMMDVLKIRMGDFKKILVKNKSKLRITLKFNKEKGVAYLEIKK